MATTRDQNETPQPAASPPARRDLNRVLSGSGVGIVQQLLHLGGRLLLTPLVIDAVGLTGFGFWSLVFLVFGVLGLHRMGFVAAGVPLVAQALGAGETQRATALLRTLGGLGLRLAALALPLLWLLAGPLAGVLGVDAAHQAAAADTLRIVGVATLVMLAFGGYQTALEALQRHATVRAVESLAGLLEVAVAATLLMSGFGLRGLAVAFALRALLPVLLFRVILRRSAPAGLRATPGWQLDAESRRSVLRTGGAMQLFGIVHVGIATVERLALVHGVSLAAAGAFEVGRKLGTLAASLPTQALAPLVPVAAKQGREAFAPRLRLITRAFAAAAALPLAALIGWPQLALQAWLGDTVGIDADLLLMVRVLAAAAFVHLLTGPTTSALRGFTSLRPEFGYTLAWLILTVVAVIPAAAFFGARGAAIAAAGAQATASLGLLWFAWPRLGIARGALLGDVLAPALAATSAVLWVQHLDPLPVLEGSDRLIALASLVRRGAELAAVALLLYLPLFPAALRLLRGRFSRTPAATTTH